MTYMIAHQTLFLYCINKNTFAITSTYQSTQCLSSPSNMTLTRETMQANNPTLRQKHHRSYGKHNNRSNNNSLKSKNKPNSIPRYPGWLEIRH